MGFCVMAGRDHLIADVISVSLSPASSSPKYLHTSHWSTAGAKERVVGTAAPNTNNSKVHLSVKKGKATIKSVAVGLFFIIAVC